MYGNARSGEFVSGTPNSITNQLSHPATMNPDCQLYAKCSNPQVDRIMATGSGQSLVAEEPNKVKLDGSLFPSATNHFLHRTS